MNVATCKGSDKIKASSGNDHGLRVNFKIEKFVQNDSRNSRNRSSGTQPKNEFPRIRPNFRILFRELIFAQN